jgi:hypothetical protein
MSIRKAGRRDSLSDYRTFYAKNQTTGNWIIDIRLEGYGDFYHEWDNARFFKRDIHPELADFLSICSADIPLSEGIEIRFLVQGTAADPAQEENLTASYWNYYRALLREGKRSLRRLYRIAFGSILIALVLLLIAQLSGQYIKENLPFTILTEGILIGGWMFMWEAASLLFFKRPEEQNTLKETRRLAEAPLRFTY